MPDNVNHPEATDAVRVDLVIYHAGCYDGFCAAWLLHRAFPHAKYLSAAYGDSPPDVTGKHVMIVDFSYKRQVLLDMKCVAASLVVLDHHKTAQEDLAGLDWCVFDMGKSGGRLTWEWLAAQSWCNPGMGGQNEPWLVAYTEDRDLWRHALAYTKEINAALRTYEMDFYMWDCLAGIQPIDLKKEGSGILRYQEKLIQSHVRHAEEITIAGHRVLAAECTAADITSEVAQALAVGRPFGVCWFQMGDERVYSLRSTPDGVDVSAVAKACGGGGHKHAAGFKSLWKRDMMPGTT